MDIAGAVLDATLQSLYESISFRAGRRPDTQRLRELLSPRAVLVHAEADGTTALSVDEFVRRLEAQVGDPLVELEEREIGRRVDRFGVIAHVLSPYETRLRVRGQDREQVVRGVNSIQLRWEQPEWRVVSILWTTESEDAPIPPELLADG